MLIQCPECQQRISDRARVCPQCGYPIVGSGDPVKDYHRARMHRVMVVILVIMTIACVMALLSPR